MKHFRLNAHALFEADDDLDARIKLAEHFEGQIDGLGKKLEHHGKLELEEVEFVQSTKMSETFGGFVAPELINCTSGIAKHLGWEPESGYHYYDLNGRKIRIHTEALREYANNGYEGTFSE